MNGTIPTLEEFYKVLEARLNGRKPRTLGAQERKVQTQREYQKEKLGDWQDPGGPSICYDMPKSTSQDPPTHDIITIFQNLPESFTLLGNHR